MTLLYGHDEALSRWAGELLGISDWGHCKAIGILRGENLVAAAVFHAYRPPNDIEISFVTVHKRWATPQDVRGIFRYPFVQVGCKRLTSITKAGNRSARTFLCRLGFVQEGYHKQAFVDDDAVSYGMLREDAARWLAEERDTGKKFTIATASTVSV